jgi:hypothetical protein
MAVVVARSKAAVLKGASPGRPSKSRCARTGCSGEISSRRIQDPQPLRLFAEAHRDRLRRYRARQNRTHRQRYPDEPRRTLRGRLTGPNDGLRQTQPGPAQDRRRRAAISAGGSPRPGSGPAGRDPPATASLRIDRASAFIDRPCRRARATAL